MTSVFRCLTILALAVLVTACGDHPTVPSGTSRPAFAISDGAHSGGNPGFFFLPPLVSNPSGHPEFRDSPFAVVSPVVRICRLSGNPGLGAVSCVADVVTFSGSQIGMSASDRQYHVNWDTRSANLNTAAFYRMSVFVGQQLLGFADVDPVTPQEMRNARSGETITLLDGRTLPIKFTIEEDGLCGADGDCLIAYVGSEGGSFTLPSGHGGIFLPAGWLPAGVPSVSLRLERVATGASNDCLEDGFTGPGIIRQYEGCLEIKTEPDLGPKGGIQKRAVVGLCLEIAETHPDRHYLSMIKSDAGRPVQRLADADPSVIAGFDCEGFAGTPPQYGSLPRPLRFLASLAQRGSRSLARLVEVQSAYAIDLGEGGQLEAGMDFSHFGWGVQGELAAVGPTSISLQRGASATLTARVLASHLHGGAESETNGVPGVPVTFTITSGSGAVMLPPGSESGSPGPLTVVTDYLGDAQVEFFPGTAAGSYTVVATANALESPVTFTINSGTFSIDFETWPAANEACGSECSLDAQYSPNAQFGFLPAYGSEPVVGPAARVAGGPFFPAANYSAAAPSSAQGAPGTLRMTLGGNPDRATFKVRYASNAVPPVYTAYKFEWAQEALVVVDGAVSYTLADVLAPSGAVVREATVTVSIPGGIYRIDIGAGEGTGATFLDDITIFGADFSPID